MTADELAHALRASLSTTGDVRMECIDVRREPAVGLFATLRLFIYDAQGVRDIKEQDVVFVRHNNVDDARVPAYAAAWCASLARAFARDGVARFEMMMPHDVVFPRVLELKKAITQADFEKAFHVKSRLG